MLVDKQAYWIYALLFATVFTFLIPWTEIRGSEFEDIENYLFRIDYLHNNGQERVYYGLAWLLSEPLWILMLHGIGDFFTNPRTALYIISFFIAIVFSSFLLKRLPVFIVIIFLINPLTIHLFLEQIRSGIGLSLLILAYENSSKKLSIILLIIAPLIHVAMLVFIGIYFLLYFLDQKVKANTYYLWVLVIAFIFALFIRYGLQGLLVIIGDRHAQSAQPENVTSVKYTIMWVLIAGIFATFADFSKRHIRIIVGYAIFMMSFVFFLSLIGSTTTRFVAAVIPLILLSINYLPKHFKQGTYLLLFTYNVLLFQYWFRAWIL